MAYILILIGLGCLGTGIYILASHKEKPVVNELTVNKSDEELRHRIQPLNFDEENRKKGNDFEKFVVQKFDRKYFALQEWRSDKYVNGIYAASNQLPDLEINFRKGNINDSFAVECKWRKGYYDNSIKWAEYYQLSNYKNYAKRLQIQVFVIIGIGGSPDSPEEIFIIPLSQLKSATISQEELRIYEKKDKGPFYWDGNRKQLH